MCDYCGCRRSGPSSELAAGHERLLELGDVLHTALHDGTGAPDVFDQFVLLQMHAAKGPIGADGPRHKWEPLRAPRRVETSVGTLHMPCRWPDRYGCDGNVPNSGYVARLVSPWKTEDNRLPVADQDR